MRKVLLTHTHKNQMVNIFSSSFLLFLLEKVKKGGLMWRKFQYLMLIYQSFHSPNSLLWTSICFFESELHSSHTQALRGVHSQPLCGVLP